MQTAVQTKQQLIEKILAHQQQIRAYGVERLGIFGSFVRDEAKESSDVDFFIDFDIEHKTLKNFVGLAYYLQDITGRKAEIVTPQSLSKYIGPYILKEVEYVSFAA